MHAPLVGADVVADVVDRRVPVIVVIGPGPIIVQAAKRVHAPSSSDEIFVGSATVVPPAWKTKRKAIQPPRNPLASLPATCYSRRLPTAPYFGDEPPYPSWQRIQFVMGG